MLNDVIKMIVPILATFLLGVMTRKTGIMDRAGCDTIKRLISRIMLPVILFNAFLLADYNRDSMVIILVVFVAMLCTLAAAFFIARFFPERKKYMPFLLTSIEGGTIGYPLCAMLFGALGTSQMAIFDVGHTVYFFLITIPILQVIDQGGADAKNLAKSVLTSPTFDAMVLGILCGVLGVDTMLANTPVFETYQSLVSFLTAPAGMLILLTLGFDLSIESKLLKPVLLTAVLRYVVMGTACAISLFIIFKIVPFTKEQFTTLMLAFALPPSYALPAFAKFEGQSDYVATTISFCTILTLIVFVGLSVYALG